MNRKGKLTIAALAVAGVTAAGIGAMAAEPTVTNAIWGGRDGGWHGGHRGGHGLMRLCGAARGERIEVMIGFVENFMEFTPEQQAAWDELATALRQGNGTVAKACDDLREAGRPESAPERLALLETALETGLNTVKEVRPSFDRFYATLSEKQRKALDDLSRHRRRR